ncbi:transcriptional regulator [Cytobacillus phage Bfsp1]|nr:transcriptional regulator [Cytobacillus phage Bfsp1]
MRKMMTKEVTSTTVKLAKIKHENGQVQAVSLPEEILLGNVTEEKAQKVMAKKHGHGVSVVGVEPQTNVYELEVEKFIEIARLKEDAEPGAETSEQAE